MTIEYNRTSWAAQRHIIRFYLFFFVGICSTATTKQQPSVGDKIWIWRHSHIHRYAILPLHTSTSNQGKCCSREMTDCGISYFCFLFVSSRFLGIEIGISKCVRSTRFLCSNRIESYQTDLFIRIKMCYAAICRLDFTWNTVCDCRVTRRVHGRHVRSCLCVNRLSVKTLLNFRFINYI